MKMVAKLDEKKVEQKDALLDESMADMSEPYLVVKLVKISVDEMVALKERKTVDLMVDQLVDLKVFY